MSSQFVAVPIEVTVGPESVLALAANPARKYLRIDNKDDVLVTFKLGEDFGQPASAVQHIAFTPEAQLAAGLFSIVFDGQETTELVPGAASAAELETALEALSNIGSGNVDVEGDFEDGFDVTFKGALANLPQNLLSVAVNTLEGPKANAVQTVTYTADGGTFTLTFGGQTTTALAFDASTATVKNALNALSTLDGAVETVGGSAGAYVVTFGTQKAYMPVALLTSASSLTLGAEQDSEAGVLYAAPAPASGSYKLMVGDQTTAALAFDDEAADIQAALEALSNVGAGNVAVAGSTLLAGMTITFQGDLADEDAPAVVPYDNALRADGPFGTEVRLDFLLTTEGNAGAKAITIATQTAGLAPVSVALAFTTTTEGQAQPADGTDIKALDNVEFADSAPIDAVYIKADSAGQVVVTEG